MLDVLCIGDALVDIFLSIPKDDPHFSLDKNKENLLINFGKKINIENYVKEIGGNACNSAVGIARLGKFTGLCAEIGKDEFSNFIFNKLIKEQVNTSFVTEDPNTKTSFSVILSYQDDRTILTEHVERPHNFNFETTSASIVYLTSLGNKWQNAYQKTLNFVKKNRVKLAFNPGTLQIEQKVHIITELIEASDFLFLNKEEAEHLLYGKDDNLSIDEKDIKKILFSLKSLGAKNIIITDSKNGSFVNDENNNIYYLNAIDTKVIEKTGAGDAYTSGFLGAVLNQKSIQEAMVWGTINSSSVITKIGAQSGLLNYSEIKEKLNYLAKLNPQLI